MKEDMKEIMFPERLMGWVKYSQPIGDTALELRFKREPNLFTQANYVLYDVHSVMLPIKMMMEIPRIRIIPNIGEELQLIGGYENEEENRYVGIMVRAVRDDFEFHLKEIPANIR